MRYRFRLMCLIAACSLLTACGFHMRNSHELPPQLQTVYFQSDNPVAPTALTLRSMLTSIGIHVVDDPSKAQYELSLSRPVTTNSGPTSSTDSSNVYNVTYTQKLTVTIVDTKTQTTILSKSLSASRSQLLNRSQVLTANTASAATKDLPNDIATSAYLWLTTDQVHAAFTHPTQSLSTPDATIKQHSSH